MSGELRKPALTDLVDPFLTEKTRRAVAVRFGVISERSRYRAHFFRSLTVGEMLEDIPTFETFRELALLQGRLGRTTLEKARIVYD